MKLEMFPPVPAPRERLDLTWESLYRLAEHDSVIRTVLVCVERGELTREQALVAAVFSLYDAKRVFFKAATDAATNSRPAPVVLCPPSVHPKSPNADQR
jgi:hypothetical protein